MIFPGVRSAMFTERYGRVRVSIGTTQPIKRIKLANPLKRQHVSILE
jgi:hypothetical protein